MSIQNTLSPRVIPIRGLEAKKFYVFEGKEFIPFGSWEALPYFYCTKTDFNGAQGVAFGKDKRGDMKVYFTAFDPAFNNQDFQEFVFEEEDGDTRKDYDLEDFNSFFVHAQRIANLSHFCFSFYNQKGQLLSMDTRINSTVYKHLCEHTSMWYWTDEPGFDTPLCGTNTESDSHVLAEELRKYYHIEHVTVRRII